MPGKSLTIRAPIPGYVKPVATYTSGRLVLVRADGGRFHQLYVRLGPDQYDHINDTGKPLPDDAARLAFVRDRVAKLREKRQAERTALLEAEADLIEEIGRARTKEQKEELRKQLDELKKVRRDLEHAIR
jgi:hypothetical protein